THLQGLEMIAADTASPPRTAAEHQQHEQHDHHDQPVADAPRSAYDRMLAGFSHHLLHRPLRAYQEIVGAAILAFLLYGCGTIFAVLMTRQTWPGLAERVGKNELAAHFEAGLSSLSSLAYSLTSPL